MTRFSSLGKKKLQVLIVPEGLEKDQKVNLKNFQWKEKTRLLWQ